MTSELYESPSGIAIPMKVNDAGTRLEATVDDYDSEPAEGLLYAQIVGGPLKIVSNSDIAAGTTTFTVHLPPLDPDLHVTSLAQDQNISIQPGDYFAPTSTSDQYEAATERRITNVVYDATGGPGNTPSWTLTLDRGFGFSFFRDTTETYTIDGTTHSMSSYNAATIIRYNAFLLIPDLTVDGLTRDSLVVYEGLEVAMRRDANDVGDPTQMVLPNNYTQNFTKLLSDSMMPYPFDEAPYEETGDNMRPFYKPASFAADGSSQLPWVRVRLAITGGDYSDVIQVGEMARVVNIDTLIYLRSGST
jgi:hypothetical protein